MSGPPSDDIRVATFDCYGTLVDWEGGAASFLYQLAVRECDEELPPGRVLRDRWEEIQFEAIQGEYRPYRQVLSESLRRLAGERGWRWNERDGEALAASMESWQPFPDTRPALLRAHEAGLRLVIVSNTQHSILEHTLRQLDLPFEGAVTAEDARAYKPSVEVFDRALAFVDEPPRHVLHVAFGFKYDIRPAAQRGMRTAWVNRHAEEPPGPDPYDHEWRDLWGLAELAGGGGPRTGPR